MDGALLVGTDLSCANLDESTAQEFEPINAYLAKFTGASIRDVLWAGVEAEQADFTCSTAARAAFERGNFLRAIFRLAKLGEVVMKEAVLGDNEWDGVTITGGEWTDVRL